MKALILSGCVVLGALFVAVGPASAQDRERARVREGGQLDGRTIYEFGDADEVYGGRAGADGVLIRPRGRARRPSLIRVRENFVPEALKSIENI